MATSVPRILSFESGEVARLRQSLGRTPSANVACVVPTYKRQEQVVAAVESILGQTHSDLVAIVVDDGAGLPSLPSDPRVVGVSLSRNVGIAGVVRNVGIRLSESKYLAFLDDDNAWKPDHLETCLRTLESSADLVYTGVARLTPDGNEYDVLSAPFDRQRLAQVSYVDTSAIVVRRAPDVLFSRLPRNRTTLPGEDWEFVYRLSRRSRVRHISEVTVDYLMNPESFYTPWGTAGVKR